MPLVVVCPVCSAKHKVPDEATGKTLRCRTCSGIMQAPGDDYSEEDSVEAGVPFARPTSRSRSRNAKRAAAPGVDLGPWIRRSVIGIVVVGLVFGVGYGGWRAIQAVRASAAKVEEAPQAQGKEVEWAEFNPPGGEFRIQAPRGFGPDPTMRGGNNTWLAQSGDDLYSAVMTPVGAELRGMAREDPKQFLQRLVDWTAERFPDVWQKKRGFVEIPVGTAYEVVLTDGKSGTQSVTRYVLANDRSWILTVNFPSGREPAGLTRFFNSLEVLAEPVDAPSIPDDPDSRAVPATAPSRTPRPNF